MSFYTNTRQEDNEQYDVSFEIGGRQIDGFPTPCSNLRAGGLVYLRGHPCEITDIHTSPASRSVVQIVGFDIHTGQFMDDQYPLRETVFVPRINNHTPSSSGRSQVSRASSRGSGSQMVPRSRQSSNAGQYLKMQCKFRPKPRPEPPQNILTIISLGSPSLGPENVLIQD
ncbi:hypothetical protein AFLA_008945 [Aspergillus flavus NRRL3357]|nr:hypothetical protein AFLA_008945 [Aspergillus flavus NRRL3357]